MQTEEREVTITILELRQYTAAILHVLRQHEHLKPPNDLMPLVHAYLFGSVMQACGLAPQSTQALLELVEIGYRDLERLRANAEQTN